MQALNRVGGKRQSRKPIKHMKIRFPFAVNQVNDNAIEIVEGRDGIRFPEVESIKADPAIPLNDAQMDKLYDVAVGAVRNEFVRLVMEVTD